MTVRGTASIRRVLAVGLLILVAAPASPAHGEDPVALEAMIDGRPVAQSGERNPIRLRPREPASLELRVTNHRGIPIEVRTVRLEGEAMALTFFAYDTSVAFAVAPGATEVRTFSLDLVGLGGQATGLIRGAVAIRDGERRTLTSQGAVFDVRGSLWSVYGLFGLAVIVLTIASLGGALIALARHQLPANRWRRGLRFLTPGLGVGLFAVFSLSALRILVPRPGVWIPILLIAGGGSFILGYLTPSPDDDEDDFQDDELDDPVVEPSEAAARPAEG